MAIFIVMDQTINPITNQPFGEMRVNDFEVLDAEDAVFFQRQLEFIKTKSYDVKYAELKFRSLWPISNEAGPGARSITYRTYDQTGMSEFIGSYAKDLPRADIGGKETTVNVRDLGISAGWTTSEIRAAVRTGTPIDSRKLNATMRGNEQKMNLISFNGDAVRGLLGLFNHPNVPIGQVVTGVGGFLWIQKTPDEILFDLNDIARDMFTSTKMIETADTMLLPPEQWALIHETSRSPNSASDTTILQYFLKNQMWIKNVEPVNEMVGAGPGGTDVMSIYRKDPDKVTFEIPMELIYHPEERRGLEILVAAEASCGGMIIYYPLSFSIRYNI